MTEQSKTESTSSLADDLLWGCKAIAREINRPEHVTFRMLQEGLIPAHKKGALWVSSKTRLRKHFDDDEVAA